MVSSIAILYLHIFLYISFHAANIRISFETSKYCHTDLTDFYCLAELLSLRNHGNHRFRGPRQTGDGYNAGGNGPAEIKEITEIESDFM